MKRILFYLVSFMFLFLPIQSRADCWCTGIPFDLWLTTGWTPFITAFAAHNGQMKLAFEQISTAIGHDANVKAGVDNLSKKTATSAEVMAAHQRDDINRRVEAQMDLVRKTVRQDTPMTRMRLTSDCVDGASIDGTNAILGSERRRELQDKMRMHGQLEGVKGKGGQGIWETTEKRRKLGSMSLNYKQLTPDTGLTYEDPETAVILGEILSMAMTPDPWIDPNLLKFDSEEKKKEYIAMLTMQKLVKDTSFNAISRYISMYAGVVDSKPIWELIRQSGGANAANPETAYPEDKNHHLSMADVYRAWAEHYLSPSLATQINSDNASSTIQQLLSRMYVVMLDGEMALQNAVSILALKQSKAQEQLEAMRSALMNSTRGSNVQ